MTDDLDGSAVPEDRSERPPIRCLLAACALLVAGPHAADAQTFWERTQLVDIRDGTSLSRSARSLGTGGYSLSSGAPVSLRHWYSSSWQDLHVTLVTQVSESLGVYWGLNTGERGEKYRIAPGLKLGFILIGELSERATLSLSATAILGGELEEGTCTANYGAIGGVQTVNCRLAASFMPPAQTLDHLVRESPPDRARVAVRYTFRF